MNSPLIQAQIAALQNGAAQQQINIGDAVDLAFPLPPLAEQRQSVVWLDSKAGHIDEARNKLERQLKLLAEYRQALIAAAVTGQIDVGAAAPDPEEALQ